MAALRHGIKNFCSDSKNTKVLKNCVVPRQNETNLGKSSRYNEAGHNITKNSCERPGSASGTTIFGRKKRSRSLPAEHRLSIQSDDCRPSSQLETKCEPMITSSVTETENNHERQQSLIRSIKSVAKRLDCFLNLKKKKTKENATKSLQLTYQLKKGTTSLQKYVSTLMSFPGVDILIPIAVPYNSERTLHVIEHNSKTIRSVPFSQINDINEILDFKKYDRPRRKPYVKVSMSKLMPPLSKSKMNNSSGIKENATTLISSVSTFIQTKNTNSNFNVTELIKFIRNNDYYFKDYILNGRCNDNLLLNYTQRRHFHNSEKTFSCRSTNENHNDYGKNYEKSKSDNNVYESETDNKHDDTNGSITTSTKRNYNNNNKRDGVLGAEWLNNKEVVLTDLDRGQYCSDEKIPPKCLNFLDSIGVLHGRKSGIRSANNDKNGLRRSFSDSRLGNNRSPSYDNKFSSLNAEKIVNNNYNNGSLYGNQHYSPSSITSRISTFGGKKQSLNPFEEMRKEYSTANVCNSDLNIDKGIPNEVLQSVLLGCLKDRNHSNENLSKNKSTHILAHNGNKYHKSDDEDNDNNNNNKLTFQDMRDSRNIDCNRTLNLNENNGKSAKFILKCEKDYSECMSTSIPTTVKGDERREVYVSKDSNGIISSGSAAAGDTFDTALFLDCKEINDDYETERLIRAAFVEENDHFELSKEQVIEEEKPLKKIEEKEAPPSNKDVNEIEFSARHANESKYCIDQISKNLIGKCNLKNNFEVHQREPTSSVFTYSDPYAQRMLERVRNGGIQDQNENAGNILKMSQPVTDFTSSKGPLDKQNILKTNAKENVKSNPDSSDLNTVVKSVAVASETLANNLENNDVKNIFSKEVDLEQRNIHSIGRISSPTNTDESFLHRKVVTSVESTYSESDTSDENTLKSFLNDALTNKKNSWFDYGYNNWFCNCIKNDRLKPKYGNQNKKFENYNNYINDRPSMETKGSATVLDEELIDRANVRTRIENADGNSKCNNKVSLPTNPADNEKSALDGGKIDRIDNSFTEKTITKLIPPNKNDEKLLSPASDIHSEKKTEDYVLKMDSNINKKLQTLVKGDNEQINRDLKAGPTQSGLRGPEGEDDKKCSDFVIEENKTSNNNLDDIQPSDSIVAFHNNTFEMIPREEIKGKNSILLLESIKTENKSPSVTVKTPETEKMTGNFNKVQKNLKNYEPEDVNTTGSIMNKEKIKDNVNNVNDLRDLKNTIYFHTINKPEFSATHYSIKKGNNMEIESYFAQNNVMYYNNNKDYEVNDTRLYGGESLERNEWDKFTCREGESNGTAGAQTKLLLLKSPNLPEGSAHTHVNQLKTDTDSKKSFRAEEKTVQNQTQMNCTERKNNIKTNLNNEGNLMSSCELYGEGMESEANTTGDSKNNENLILKEKLTYREKLKKDCHDTLENLILKEKLTDGEKLKKECKDTLENEKHSLQKSSDQSATSDKKACEISSSIILKTNDKHNYTHRFNLSRKGGIALKKNNGNLLIEDFSNAKFNNVLPMSDKKLISNEKLLKGEKTDLKNRSEFDSEEGNINLLSGTQSYVESNKSNYQSRYRPNRRLSTGNEKIKSQFFPLESHYKGILTYQGIIKSSEPGVKNFDSGNDDNNNNHNKSNDDNVSLEKSFKTTKIKYNANLKQGKDIPRKEVSRTTQINFEVANQIANKLESIPELTALKEIVNKSVDTRQSNRFSSLLVLSKTTSSLVNTITSIEKAKKSEMHVGFRQSGGGVSDKEKAVQLSDAKLTTNGSPSFCKKEKTHKLEFFEFKPKEYVNKIRVTEDDPYKKKMDLVKKNMNINDTKSTKFGFKIEEKKDINDSIKESRLEEAEIIYLNDKKLKEELSSNSNLSSSQSKRDGDQFVINQAKDDVFNKNNKKYSSETTTRANKVSYKYKILNSPEFATEIIPGGNKLRQVYTDNKSVAKQFEILKSQIKKKEKQTKKYRLTVVKDSSDYDFGAKVNRAKGIFSTTKPKLKYNPNNVVKTRKEKSDDMKKVRVFDRYHANVKQKILDQYRAPSSELRRDGAINSSVSNQKVNSGNSSPRLFSSKDGSPERWLNGNEEDVKIADDKQIFKTNLFENEGNAFNERRKNNSSLKRSTPGSKQTGNDSITKKSMGNKSGSGNSLLNKVHNRPGVNGSSNESDGLKSPQTSSKNSSSVWGRSEEESSVSGFLNNLKDKTYKLFSSTNIMEHFTRNEKSFNATKPPNESHPRSQILNTFKGIDTASMKIGNKRYNGNDSVSKITNNRTDKKLPMTENAGAKKLASDSHGSLDTITHDWREEIVLNKTKLPNNHRVGITEPVSPRTRYAPNLPPNKTNRQNNNNNGNNNNNYFVTADKTKTKTKFENMTTMTWKSPHLTQKTNYMSKNTDKSKKLNKEDVLANKKKWMATETADSRLSGAVGHYPELLDRTNGGNRRLNSLEDGIPSKSYLPQKTGIYGRNKVGPGRIAIKTRIPTTAKDKKTYENNTISYKRNDIVHKKSNGDPALQNVGKTSSRQIVEGKSATESKRTNDFRPNPNDQFISSHLIDSGRLLDQKDVLQHFNTHDEPSKTNEVIKPQVEHPSTRKYSPRQVAPSKHRNALKGSNSVLKHPTVKAHPSFKQQTSTSPYDFYRKERNYKQNTKVRHPVYNYDKDRSHSPRKHAHINTSVLRLSRQKGTGGTKYLTRNFSILKNSQHEVPRRPLNVLNGFSNNVKNDAYNNKNLLHYFNNDRTSSNNLFQFKNKTSTSLLTKSISLQNRQPKNNTDHRNDLKASISGKISSMKPEMKRMTEVRMTRDYINRRYLSSLQPQNDYSLKNGHLRIIKAMDSLSQRHLTVDDHSSSNVFHNWNQK